MYKHTHNQTQILLYKYAEIHVYLCEENFNIYILYIRDFSLQKFKYLRTLYTAEWIFVRFDYFFWLAHFEKLIWTGSQRTSSLAYRGSGHEICQLSWLTNSALLYEPRCGGGCGVSAVQLYTWSPNKLWRSNSIFNLCCHPLKCDIT